MPHNNLRQGCRWERRDRRSTRNGPGLICQSMIKYLRSARRPIRTKTNDSIHDPSGYSQNIWKKECNSRVIKTGHSESKLAEMLSQRIEYLNNLKRLLWLS